MSSKSALNSWRKLIFLLGMCLHLCMCDSIVFSSLILEGGHGEADSKGAGVGDGEGVRNFFLQTGSFIFLFSFEAFICFSP